MAFERLQKLGKEKFGFILNQLMTGKPAMQLARDLQQEGLFQDVGEKSLTQQLNRLRLVAAEGAFGSEVAKQLEKGHTPHIPALAKVSRSTLEHLEAARAAHWEFLELLLTQVKTPVKKDAAEKPVLSVSVTTINETFQTYNATLKDIQKLRFDLGLDTLVAPPVTGVKGTQTTATLPDGTRVEQQVLEAITTAEGVFARHGLPTVLEHRR